MNRLVALTACCALCALAGCTPGPSGSMDPCSTPGCADETFDLKCAACSTPVATTLGRVRGVAAAGTRVFKGIPYAQPPVQALRFKPPRAMAPWSDIRPAEQFGNKCTQVDHGGQVIGDEDCLTLNVWVPRRVEAPLPVLVFIHGGKNVEGSSSDFSDGAYVYDGAYLAAHGPAMVVTLNYRLGSLGFLAHASLAAESSSDVSGNYGLLDQISALEWVQKNAAAFGGDPTRVLAFGHSAGANDVCALVASPLAKGLFTRAMLLSQSGDCYTSTRSQAEKAGARVAADVGCGGAANVADCLRKKTAAAIVLAPALGNVRKGSDFNVANVDGHLLLDHPLALIKGRQHSAMPIIVSSTADEFTTLGVARVDDRADLEREVGVAYGAQYADDIVALYPSSELSAHDALVELLSDDWFTCSARSLSRALDRPMAPPVYRGFFTHTFEVGRYRPFRAGHGMELFFGFHSFGTVPASEAELALADQMVGYWTRFAATGDPNGGASLPWPRYEGGLDNTLRLDTASVVMNGVRPARCNYWDWYWSR